MRAAGACPAPLDSVGGDDAGERRLERTAASDGVFSIAATLRVINLNQGPMNTLLERDI
jgi:hypothetical protein